MCQQPSGRVQWSDRNAAVAARRRRPMSRAGRHSQGSLTKASCLRRRMRFCRPISCCALPSWRQRGRTIATPLLQLLAVAVITWFFVRSERPSPAGGVCWFVRIAIVIIGLHSPIAVGDGRWAAGRSEIAEGIDCSADVSLAAHRAQYDATIASALSAVAAVRDLLPPRCAATKLSRDAAVLMLLAVIVVEIMLGARN